MGAMNRIQLEAQDLRMHPPATFSAGPIGADIFMWQAAIMCPPDFLGAGHEGVLYLSICLPSDYPFKPPEARARSPTRGVDLERMNIFQDHWAPDQTIAKVLHRIASK